MTNRTNFHGWADPTVSACFDAFRANFEEGGELGAACTIFQNGKPILDAWGGIADQTTGDIWRHNTAVPVFSVTKGIAALCVLIQVERGEIALDRHLTDYWPEFGVEGKDRVTVRDALGHRAGVPMITGPVSRTEFADPVHMAARLAAEKPVFEPGSAHAYHALTIGWITSELVRRTTGQTVGAWFRKNVAEPRLLNIAIGRGPDDDSPVAIVDVPAEHDTPDIDPQTDLGRPISMNGLIVPRVSGLAAALNDPEIQRSEQAGANAIADAQSLAKLYATTLAPVGGDRLLSDETITDACRVVSQGPQWGGVPSLPGPVWGAGLMLPGGVQPMLGAGSFGHDGMGGSVAFAHMPSGVSFAYVRNKAGQPGVVDPLVYRVVSALADVLDIQIPQV